MTRDEIIAHGDDPGMEGLLWVVTEEDGSTSCGWYEDSAEGALIVSQ